MKFKKTGRIVVALSAIVFSIAMLSFTTNDEWVKLGQRKVNYGIDHDVINLKVRDGAFTQVRFEVKHGSLNMLKCVVHFQNGEKQELEVRHNFGQGSETRDIDLKGNKRFIDKISFWYDTKTVSDKRAVLVLYGNHN